MLRSGLLALVLIMLAAVPVQAEIHISASDIGPSHPESMLLNSNGRFFPRNDSWQVSSSQFGYPEEWEGADHLEATLYFHAEAALAGNIDFALYVGSRNVGEAWNYSPWVVYSSPVAPGAYQNIRKQTYTVPMNSVPMRDLAHVGINRQIYGATTDTFVGGVYVLAIRIRAVHPPSGIVSDAVPSPALLHATPNPFSGKVSLEAEAGSATEALFRIYDVQGRLVEELKPQVRAGRVNAEWSSPAASAGIYFIELHLDGRREVGKLVKLD